VRAGTLRQPQEGDVNTMAPVVTMRQLLEAGGLGTPVLANGRCDQENVIEQLKNGVNAMRMPVNDLLSNWAYMVMAGLAWNLKAWYGLLVPNRERGGELVRMEFRRFLNAILLLPCQVVLGARRVTYRILGYNEWLKDFFATWERLQGLVLVE